MTIYIDPSPAGWAYGFPKPLPPDLAEQLIRNEEGANERLFSFLKEEGYPCKGSFIYRLLFMEDKEDE